ncbi:MAG: anti-phage dCTP deaminase [Acidobacteriaceae bacterium]
MASLLTEGSFSELVFGFVYPVGINADPIVSACRNYLTQYGYESQVFRVSDELRTLELDVSFDDNSPYGKRDALIKAGNKAREITKDDKILAAKAITEIASQRPLDQEQRPVPKPKTAYFVRSFKRPEEVALFREIYRSGFYLIGIASDDDAQMKYLRDELGIPESLAKDLIERDQNEQHLHGQRTRDTFYLSDVFIEARHDRYKPQVERFLELVFGHPFITPRKEEHAMFLAYASAARSAQLGRQVGAAIATPEGDVLAVGMNEVPSSRGGLYWEGDPRDARDHTRSIDSNAEHRNKIVKSIVQKLGNRVLDAARLARLLQDVLPDKVAGENLPKLEDDIKQKLNEDREELIDEALACEAVSSSELREITEYGRAVHGEMDAILTCARLGISVKGNYLFVTTFPCHNCSRHIVASGITRVYYVEPYPKSKARDLHSDSVCFDEKEAAKTGKIPFLPFVGIGPRRYLDFFSLELTSGRPVERKDDNHAPINVAKKGRPPRVPLIPLSFLEREDKLLTEYRDILTGLQGKQPDRGK